LQLIEWPCFTNLKRAIVIFSRLVHLNKSRILDGYNYYPLLLMLSGRIRRRWTGLIHAIFLNTDMCDVGFSKLASLVNFAET